MKKFLSIMVISFLCSLFVPQVEAQRFGTPPSGDNTGRTVTFNSKTKALASTDSIYPNASYTYYKFDTLTGAKTIRIKPTSAKKWDVVTLVFSADTLTAGRVVTFGTTSGGTKILWTTTSGNTVTVKRRKSVVMVFEYDGSRWAEVSRSIEY